MKTLFIVAAGLTLALAAQAQTPAGGYLAVGAGVSKYNDSCEGLSQCDTTGTGFKFTGGYALGNGFAVEGVYLNFGKSSASAAGLSVEVKSTAFGLGGAYTLPLSSSWDFVARLGVARVKTKGTVIGLGSASDTGTSPYFGLALGWKMSPSTYLELGWDSTQARFEGEKESVSALTLGLGLRF